MKNPREVAYIAALNALQEKAFIADTLDKIYLSTQDRALANEIAMGTVRRKLTLHYYLEQLGKPPAKRKEKVLLYTALYQLKMMDRLPPYAILDETVKIGKKYCHPTFVKFLNATLRKAVDFSFEEPTDPSILYSFPEEFVNKVDIETLQNLNKRPILTARERPGFTMRELGQVVDSPDLYIQNATPAKLVEEMGRHTPPPNSILDLCASPGGKTIACYDLFPNAELTANDISAKKLTKLRENFTKYNVPVTLTQFPGEEYPLDQTFDLVIVDAPCSNSGVYHKKPEARWRKHSELPTLQKKLLKRALQLVSPGGRVWYMTCSILPEENEEIILPFDAVYKNLIFPKGFYDGWFGAVIK